MKIHNQIPDSGEIRPEWKEFLEFARDYRKKGRIVRIKLDAQLIALKIGKKINDAEYRFAIGTTPQFTAAGTQ